MFAKFKILAFCIMLCCTKSLAQDDIRNNNFWVNNNLDIKVFRNGDSLFFAQTNEEWKLASEEMIPAYCYAYGDSKKGVLYNWSAVDDPRGLAPCGYRIPTLQNFLELSKVDTVNSNWKPHQLDTNGFKAQSWGFRSFDGGDFFSEGFAAYYWTSDQGSTFKSKSVVILVEGMVKQENRREDGLAVRCIKIMDPICDFPDNDAQFIHKNLSYREWLQQNVAYPEQAIEENISGKVLVRFIVEDIGCVSNVMIIETCNSDLGFEAKRLICSMPNWIPATKNGIVVRSSYNIPIGFILE